MKTKYALFLGAACLSASLSAPAGDALSNLGTLSQVGSALGGLFHKKPKTEPQPNASQQFDCAQIAANPNSGMTVETCQKMLAAQQQYNAAASDPGANRPGDEQMTCDQIKAELKQQTYTKPDAQHLAQMQTAIAEQQQLNQKQQTEANAVMAREQAETTAAANTDRVAELASGGLLQTNTLAAVQKKHDAENKVLNEKLQQEQRPVVKNTMNSTTGLVGDMTQQIGTNPRLGRLIQLATAKGCKGG